VVIPLILVVRGKMYDETAYKLTLMHLVMQARARNERLVLPKADRETIASAEEDVRKILEPFVPEGKSFRVMEGTQQYSPSLNLLTGVFFDGYIASMRVDIEI